MILNRSGKFLKSNTTEFGHILSEFERIALANPDVEFKLYHNDSQLFSLPRTNVRQRIVGVFGKKINQNLVAIDAETSIINVRGFIVKTSYPEPVRLTKTTYKPVEKTYVCHCDDVSMDEILETIGDRKFISADEVKHTTRLGMGACRGKRCIKRLSSVSNFSL